MNKYTILVIALVVLLVSCQVAPLPEPKPTETFKEGIAKFASYEELEKFIKSSQQRSYYNRYYGGGPVFAMAESSRADGVPVSSVAEKSVSPDFSTTNIQVAGVDEADLVKSDGRYLYVVSGNKVSIVDAFPAESARVVSTIKITDGTIVDELFVHDDKLVVFYHEFPSQVSSIANEVSARIGIIAPRYESSKLLVGVYDVSDRSNPVLKRSVGVSGNYYDSRMIGSYVYVIASQPVYNYGPGPVPLPVFYRESEKVVASASDIYHFPVPGNSFVYTNILGININDDSEDVSTKTFLMDHTQTVYVSQKNLYVVYTKYFSEADFFDKRIGAIIPLFPSSIQSDLKKALDSDKSQYEKMQEVEEAIRTYVESLGPENAADFMKQVDKALEEVQGAIAKESEKTIIHKISLDGKNIEYVGEGKVPGVVLNQFSMDEKDEFFRIATTTNNWRDASLNHLFVLDKDLKIIGKVEGLAKGERIYSVRFVGDKAFMVTFRQIDPLFVIDLSSPENPKVEGFLKIPGVSDYLHPYDETHIIGVGRDANEEGRIKGMKLSLFDVSDVANPKEVSKYFIGDQGTHSEALNDHKAFLFSKSKNLLVIPVRVSEKDNWNAFQGAYVFSLDLENGFDLKGRITHHKPSKPIVPYEPYYYDYDYTAEIRRSLYIDGVLYTVSAKKIMMNDLSDLKEINKVSLPFDEPKPIPEHIGVEG